jgi:hemoglobin
METTTTYEKIGGDPVVVKLCARFYELMDTVPQFAELRAMHPADLKNSSEKLLHVSLRLDGRAGFVRRKFGHPRLRGRHMPFSIGLQERDQWVACMVLAMEDVGIDEAVRAKLLENFFHTADFMRNKEG